MPEVEHPEISIVIPAYNASKTLPFAIEACLQQEYPEGKVEIIVVDDGSSDNTGSIVQKYPVRYIYQHNRGPASARNTGWLAADGRIVCFTDADCVPAKNWVAQLVVEYASDDIAGVGGTYDIANADNLLAGCVHEEIVQRHLKMPRYVDYLGSFNASYRRRVLEEVGGFDESYRMASGEDNDLAYRVIEHGYKLVFTREAKVAHYHPTKLWQYLTDQFWHGYWRIKLYRGHPRMMRGDVYGGLLDLIQPPLALLILVLLPLAHLTLVAYLVSVLMSAVVAMQIPRPVAIIRRTGRMRYVALAPITFLRAFARGLGLAVGLVKFFICEGLHDQKKKSFSPSPPATSQKAAPPQ